MADKHEEKEATTPEYETRTVIVSAPGKILLVGGYLVLDPDSSGLVIGVNRRFYSQCTVVDYQLPHTNNNNNNSSRPIDIVVQSPQLSACWKYTFDPKRSDDATTGLLTSHPSNGSQNIFIETALSVVLQYYYSSSNNNNNNTSIRRLELTLCGDNDFYSLIHHLQARHMNLSQGDQLPPCLPIVDANTKTGLGSSACLTTAVVGSLLYALLRDNDKTTTTTTQHSSSSSSKHGILEITCGLSQLSHCTAQHKIGSGFDVSAACYGSQIYRRFAKSILESHMNGTPDFATLLQQSTLINGVQRPIVFTESSPLQVIMADVRGGSESPSMARTVLEWRATQTAHPSPWTHLQTLNPQLYDLFVDIQTSHDTAKVPQLAALFRQYRTWLKQLGVAANVPIEPDAQSRLCDATEQLPGVVTALVPGAGGYDAIVVVHENGPNVRSGIAEFWTTWTETTVCALTVCGVSYGDGLRVEKSFPLASSSSSLSFTE